MTDSLALAKASLQTGELLDASVYEDAICQLAGLGGDDADVIALDDDPDVLQPVGKNSAAPAVSPEILAARRIAKIVETTALGKELYMLAYLSRHGGEAFELA